MHIAKRFLLPKQLLGHGLTEEQVLIAADALKQVATDYTREAGVRSLERTVGSIVRFKAVQWAEFLDDDAVSAVKKRDAEDFVFSDQEGTIIQKAYSAMANGDLVSGSRIYHPRVEVADLEAILGFPRWDENERDREERRGLVYGLVVMGQGEGGVLPVETVAVPGRGALKLTGSLGEVCYCAAFLHARMLTSLRSSKRARSSR